MTIDLYFFTLSFWGTIAFIFVTVVASLIFVIGLFVLNHTKLGYMKTNSLDKLGDNFGICREHYGNDEKNPPNMPKKYYYWNDNNYEFTYGWNESDYAFRKRLEGFLKERTNEK